jgi:hypothetical protein
MAVSVRRHLLQNLHNMAPLDHGNTLVTMLAAKAFKNIAPHTLRLWPQSPR